MLKFLAKIQFSIEMTMWLTVFVVHFGLFKVYASDTISVFSCMSRGAKLPALTLFITDSFGWVRWWMIPIVFFVLVVVEWKYSIPKWLQWIFKLSIFALILITILALALPMISLCSVIK